MQIYRGLYRSVGVCMDLWGSARIYKGLYKLIRGLYGSIGVYKNLYWGLHGSIGVCTNLLGVCMDL